MKIGILNGPNLNRLGLREPQIYGSTTLSDLENLLKAEATKSNIEIDFFQSNHEGELVEKIHQWAEEGFTGAICNPAAFTHTSVALRDSIASTDLKVVEVHISNIYKREEFRHNSFTAPVSVGVISGLGIYGYVAALNYFTTEI